MTDRKEDVSAGAQSRRAALTRMLKMHQLDYDAIRQHGEETYPHECCGVLLGRSGEDGRAVMKTVRCGNTRSDSPHNGYQIVSPELVAIQRRAREQALRFVTSLAVQARHSAA